MTEYLTDIPSDLNPEYVRVWLNNHATLGHRLITVYTWDTKQVFVFEHTIQPPNWLVFDKKKIGLHESAHV